MVVPAASASAAALSPSSSASASVAASALPSSPYGSVRRSRRGKSLPSTPRSHVSATPPTGGAMLASPTHKFKDDGSKNAMDRLWPGEIIGSGGGGINVDAGIDTGIDMAAAAERRDDDNCGGGGGDGGGIGRLAMRRMAGPGSSANGTHGSNSSSPSSKKRETLSGPGGWRMVVEVDDADSDADDEEEKERRDNAAAAGTSSSTSTSISTSASPPSTSHAGTTASIGANGATYLGNGATMASPTTTPTAIRFAGGRRVVHHRHHHRPFAINSAHVELTNLPSNVGCSSSSSSYYSDSSGSSGTSDCSDSDMDLDSDASGPDEDDSELDGSVVSEVESAVDDDESYDDDNDDDDLDDDGSYDDDDGSASVAVSSIASSMFDNDRAKGAGRGDNDDADAMADEGDDDQLSDGSSGSWSIDRGGAVEDGPASRRSSARTARTNDDKTLEEILDEQDGDDLSPTSGIDANDEIDVEVNANINVHANVNTDAARSIVGTDLDLDSPRNISEYYARGAQNALGLVLHAAAGVRANDTNHANVATSPLSQADLSHARSAIDAIDQALAKSVSMVGATTLPRRSEVHTPKDDNVDGRVAEVFTFSDVGDDTTNVDGEEGTEADDAAFSVDNDVEEDVSTRASEDYDDDDEGFSDDDDLGSATEDDLDESSLDDEDLSLTDEFGEYYNEDEDSDDDDRYNVREDDEGFEVTASPPTSPLLVHGILPSGRPLVYERKPGEQVILRGVLPSGRKVDIPEAEACLLSEQLSFDTYSPRSASVAKSPRGTNRGSLAVLPTIADDGKSKTIASPSNFLGRGLDPYTTTEGQFHRFADGRLNLVADDSMLEETPVIANGKHVIPSPSEDILNMSFPLELAHDDMMPVEKKEKARADKEARKKKSKNVKSFDSSSDDTANLDVDGAAIMKTYLKRMQLFDTAQRMGEGSELPQSPPVAAAFDAKDLQIDRVDAVLLEPKKDLREVINTIAGIDNNSASDASHPAVESRDDSAGRRGSDLSGIETMPTVATELVANLKQATVRRENACGLLCMMVRSSPAKSTIGHTRGVIPALSAALVDKNASTEQKHRCLNALILLSQDSKVHSIMLRFSAITNALKASAIDESPQVRQLVFALLINLNKDKSNRTIVCKFFLGRATHIIELASAFDDVLPHRGHRRSGSELVTVLSDMTMDRSLEDDIISANDTAYVAGNLRPDECDEETKASSNHQVYFEARSSALKVLLDLSNVAKLTTIMARHENLLATLLRQADSLKAGDSMIIMAILTNLTRHPANSILLVSNESFVSVLTNGVSNSCDKERQKCALYALRNLTVDHKAQGLIIANTPLLLALTKQYSDSTETATRVEILRILQNLSNYPTSFVKLAELNIPLALLTSIRTRSTPAEEKHVARDILAASGKWAWSSAHTATQAKAIYLGEDIGKSFGYRNPPKPNMDVRRAGQWV